MKNQQNRSATNAKRDAKKTKAARLASLEAARLRADEHKKAMLYCFEVGITKVTDACAYAGVSQTWYTDHIKSDPAFVEAIEKAKSKRKTLALARILQAGQTSWQAHAWFLERVHSEEFALKQRLEHTGKDDSPIVLQIAPAPPSKLLTQGTGTNAHGSDTGD